MRTLALAAVLAALVAVGCSFDTAGVPVETVDGLVRAGLGDGGLQLPNDDPGWGVATPQDPGDETDESGPLVPLCHLVTKKPLKAHTIEVEPSSVQPHLDHGDSLGPCEM